MKKNEDLGRVDTPSTGEDRDLRRRAEKKARKKPALPAEAPETMTPEEARRLLHDLRVHQIELEMQNEELRRAQVELEASQARYLDLYDMAPVGYATLNEKGLVLEANLTAAGLLGLTKSELVGRPLTRFIVPEYQDAYYLHRKRLFETGEPQSCELRLLRKNSSSFWAQLEANIARDAGGAPLCRAILSDIADRKKEQADLAKKELRYLSRQVIIAQEEERKRLSRELHDSLGQKIISIQLEIEWLKNRETGSADNNIFDNMLEMTIDASDELQRICLGLRPLIMDRIGFTAAIKVLLEEFEANSEMSIVAKIMSVDETRLGPGVNINLYRILQEALTNIIRHSKTREAIVSLCEEGAELVLDVKDNGCGFEENQPEEKYHFGILGMKERVSMCGGRFEITSKPGKGVHIRASIPFSKRPEEQTND